MDESFSQLSQVSQDAPSSTASVQITTIPKTPALNISLYNYLGFAQACGGCADAVEECIKRYGISTCGLHLEGGLSDLCTISKALVVKFVDMEDALISSMGFMMNSMYTLPIVKNMMER